MERGSGRQGDVAPGTRAAKQGLGHGCLFIVPEGDILLIERNTGSVADVVETLGSADDGWFGPAAFDRTP